MIARLAGLLVLALGACSPLVRYGDIEPSRPGDQVLVEVRVVPIDRAPPPDVVLAAGRGAMRRLALTAAPLVPSAVVASEMASKVQSSDVGADDALVDTTELGPDARRVEAMYAARGYFQAELVDSTLDDLGNGRMRFEVFIAEGPPTRVREVVFVGIAQDLEDEEARRRLAIVQEELAESLPLARGDVWDEEGYLRSLATIQSAFRNQGFIHATVTGESFVSREENLAAVRFDVDHGPLVRADGKAVVVSNEEVSKARILRRVPIEDGDVLEAEALRETEQQVFELGHFFAVQARAVRGEGELGVIESEPRAPEAPGAPGAPGTEAGIIESDLPDRLPLEVKVTEAPPWELTIGPAAITDSTRLELALPIAFTHRSIFAEVAQLRASVKPALVFPVFWEAADCCAVSEFGLVGKLGIDVPSFFEEFLRLSTQVGYERDPTEPQKEAVVARIGVSRRLGAGFTASLGYDLSQVFYFADSPLEKVDRDLAIGVSDFRYRDNDRVMWLGASLVFDRRDGLYDARRGAYAALTLDGGHPWLGSTIEFFRTSLEARGYITLDALPWLTLAVRGKAGMTFFPSAQGTPESIRFESGGPNAHRGFRTERMGDYACVGGAGVGLIGSDFSNTDPSCGGAATDRIYLGGNYVFEANVELRVQPGTLGFAVFLDAGRLWSRFEKIDFRDLFVAVGPGLRLTTPVGPLRVDLGLLLGRDRDRVFHLSLGQAF
ncbi:MAG: BamA/TamA family outer membrane protein [Deltaproteobacteria bacterium]|nr:BamA/TamA family outer membrane protein [Deltaproteobacteria bacterium]